MVNTKQEKNKKITKLKTVIKSNNRVKILSAMLYINIVVFKNIRLSNNELNILSLFIDDNDIHSVINKSIKMRFVNSTQSCNNTISLLTRLKLLNKIKKNSRTISKDIINKEVKEKISINITLHNIDN